MAEAPPLLGIAGWSGSGKTTLIERLIASLTARGLRVATVKHTHHALKRRDSATDGEPPRPRRRHSRRRDRPAGVGACGRGAALGAARASQRWSRTSRRPISSSSRASRARRSPRSRCAATPTERPLAADDPHVIAVASDQAVEARGLPVFPLDDVDAIADFIVRPSHSDRAGESMAAHLRPPSPLRRAESPAAGAPRAAARSRRRRYPAPTMRTTSATAPHSAQCASSERTGSSVSRGTVTRRPARSGPTSAPAAATPEAAAVAHAPFARAHRRRTSAPARIASHSSRLTSVRILKTPSPRIGASPGGATPCCACRSTHPDCGVPPAAHKALEPCAAVASLTPTQPPRCRAAAATESTVVCDARQDLHDG